MNLDIFNEEYMRKRKYIAWRAPIVVSSIIETMEWEQNVDPFSSKEPIEVPRICDVGCSIGELLIEFINKGYCYSIGIDGSEAAQNIFFNSHPPVLGIHDHFIKYDFTTNKHQSVEEYILSLFEYDKFDLVLCLEVFSVVDYEYWEVLLDLICCTLNAKTILISLPYEKERDLLDKIRRRGYEENTDKIISLQTLLHGWHKKPAIKSLYWSGRFWDKI